MPSVRTASVRLREPPEGTSDTAPEWLQEDPVRRDASEPNNTIARVDDCYAGRMLPSRTSGHRRGVTSLATTTPAAT
jgi:hypothetical protein